MAVIFSAVALPYKLTPACGEKHLFTI